MQRNAAPAVASPNRSRKWHGEDRGRMGGAHGTDAGRGWVRGHSACSQPETVIVRLPLAEPHGHQRAEDRYGRAQINNV